MVCHKAKRKQRGSGGATVRSTSERAKRRRALRRAQGEDEDEGGEALAPKEQAKSRRPRSPALRTSLRAHALPAVAAGG